MSTGTTQSQLFSTPGAFTFNVPAGVSSVDVSAIAGGGAGLGRTSGTSTGGEGGGSGEYCIGVSLQVTPGGTLTGVVGSKGTGVSSNNGNSGTATTVGPFTLLPGEGAQQTVSHTGHGGGYNGAAGVTSGVGLVGGFEFGGFGGGSSGGFRGAAAGVGLAGGGAPGQLGGAGGGATATRGGGGGGGSSPWGPGGAGGAGNDSGAANGPATPATSYGAGGGGSGAGTSNSSGGAGADGMVLITWVA